MIFSLETSSDYIKDEKACFYGFKCSLVGYEWNTKTEEVGNLLSDLSNLFFSTQSDHFHCCLLLMYYFTWKSRCFGL